MCAGRGQRIVQLDRLNEETVNDFTLKTEGEVGHQAFRCQAGLARCRGPARQGGCCYVIAHKSSYCSHRASANRVLVFRQFSNHFAVVRRLSFSGAAWQCEPAFTGFSIQFAIFEPARIMFSLGIWGVCEFLFTGL